MSNKTTLDVTIIGGGMIVTDLILPTVYHLQRTGVVGAINLCDRSNAPIRVLKQNSDIRKAFPGQDFTAHPPLTEPGDKVFADLYLKVLAAARPRQVAIIAVPDQLHYQMVKAALSCDQHVLCVKPLVLNYAHAKELEELALSKGLFIGIEYHKRFDRRALVAKSMYAEGRFGEFVMGEAKLIEPYYYRDSNFQNWFLCDKTDPFVYVGCHYVDLTYFITGLKPVSVSVSGVKGKFPNGNTGYLWANGRIRYENGAIMSISAGLGYPNDGAGSNDQAMLLYCEGKGCSGMIQHDDQDRGVRHSYVEGTGCGGTRYNYVSPDFFRLVIWEGQGLKPVGYGPDSISANVETMVRMERETAALDPAAALAQRREMIRKVDEAGMLATPANSYINELVVEAARLSIVADGDWVDIVYGKQPHVEARKR
jgi:D-galacturonate reductase